MLCGLSGVVLVIGVIMCVKTCVKFIKKRRVREMLDDVSVQEFPMMSVEVLKLD